MKYLLLPIIFAFVKAQTECDGVPDGTVIEWGCRAYTYCENGQPVIEDCSEKGQVYNPDKQECDDPSNTPAPCGSNRANMCAYWKNGRFADWIEVCEYYYTCQDGLYFGHNSCSPGTVFDEVACLCNYPSEVYAPCGNKPDDENKPTKRGCDL